MITYSRLGKHGRLGNQLWQIASTLGIAQTLGQPAGFFHWDYRPFFSLPDEFFPETIVGRAWKSTDAWETPLAAHLPVPEGREYLQDYNLWKHIEPQIRTWFRPSEIAIRRIRELEWFCLLPRPTLAVHVRLGDNYFAPNPYHPIRPWGYYRTAIESLYDESESVVVFSDNPEIARQHLGDLEGLGHNICFFQHSKPRKKEHEKGYRTDPFDDWVDLIAMTMCDLHIISNSTYAWWGAFLSSNPAPIYPWPWFGPALKMLNADLMFPEKWRKFEHG